MTDRILLSLMSAAILGSAMAGKPKKPEDSPSAEDIVDAAEELLNEVDDRCDEKGKLIEEEEREGADDGDADEDEE